MKKESRNDGDAATFFLNMDANGEIELPSRAEGHCVRIDPRISFVLARTHRGKD